MATDPIQAASDAYDTAAAQEQTTATAAVAAAHNVAAKQAALSQATDDASAAHNGLADAITTFQAALSARQQAGQDLLTAMEGSAPPTLSSASFPSSPLATPVAVGPAP